MMTKVGVIALVAVLALAITIPIGVKAAVNQFPPDVKSFFAHPPFMGPGHGQMGRRGGIVSESVLQLLKLDQEQLREKLKSGKTLAQIAEEQGVSRDALKSALRESFDEKLNEMKTRFSENLDSMIDSTMPKKPNRMHHGKPSFEEKKENMQ